MVGIDLGVGWGGCERHPLPLSLRSGGLVRGMINRSLRYPCQQPKIEAIQEGLRASGLHISLLSLRTCARACKTQRPSHPHLCWGGRLYIAPLTQQTCFIRFLVPLRSKHSNHNLRGFCLLLLRCSDLRISSNSQ